MNSLIRNSQEDFTDFYDSFNLFAEEIEECEPTKESFISLLEQEHSQHVTLTEMCGIKIECQGTEVPSEHEASPPQPEEKKSSET